LFEIVQITIQIKRELGDLHEMAGSPRQSLALNCGDLL
jgi:hypothetical protein